MAPRVVAMCPEALSKKAKSQEEHPETKRQSMIRLGNKGDMNRGEYAGKGVLMKSLGKTERHFGCNSRD